jgi:DNA-binding response OmpR family regulator
MPKVLLLHTEPPLFELLKSKLEQGGFEVVGEAQDIGTSTPDLIILGKHVQEQPAFMLPEESTAPVILLSSGASDEQGELSQLKMPFRPSDLVELARKTVATS